MLCRCIKIVDDFPSRFKVGQDYTFGRYKQSPNIFYIEFVHSTISFTEFEFYESFSISAIRDEKLEKLLQ